MIRICAAILVLTAGLTAFSPAQASGGCGWGAHRGPYGGCRANGSNRLLTPPPRAVVVGPRGRVFYAAPGRACPYGYHLGPAGRRCWPN